MKFEIRKKISKISLVLLLLTSLSSVSCKKWLDLQPEDGLIEQDYWRTKEQLKSAVMGCYASMLDGSAIPLTKYLFMWGELRADMVTSGFSVDDNTDLSTLNNLRRDQLFLIRTEIDATNSIVNWEAVYRTINYCNDVIKNGPKVLETDNTITQTQVNQYLAEARGLRGLMYFYLLRTFKEVPLKTEPTSTDKDIVALPKNSAEEVSAAIIDDLKFAAENGATSYPTMAEDRGRINSYTAYTILADVYLWNENYQECINACNKVKESGRYRLLPKGILQDDFANNVYRDKNSIESIFEIQFDIQKRNPFWNMFINNREFQAKDWIVEGDLYGINYNDVKDGDIRGNGTSYNEGGGNIIKFTLGRTDATSISNWMVYRYADILLMEAEALTWLEAGNATNGAAALKIVNDLRDLRNALPVTTKGPVEIPAPEETKKISDLILEERAREFAFEGKRWFDILRHAKRGDYAGDNIELLINIASANALPSKQQTVINKYRDKRSHYLPIYFTELQTNKALVQNSFY
jgi:hypothetical protein